MAATVSGVFAATPTTVPDAAATASQAQSSAVARVVLDIVSYVRWPSPVSDIHLCVIGPTEYADELLASSHPTYGRDVHVQRRPVQDEELALGCEVLYIGVIDELQRRHLVAHVTGQPVLTISEQSYECADGAMVCLDIAVERVGFRINLDAVARSNVKIHPTLLRLSRGNGQTP